MLTQNEVNGYISQLGDNTDSAGRTAANRLLTQCSNNVDCNKKFGTQIDQAYKALGMTPKQIEGLPAEDEEADD